MLRCVLTRQREFEAIALPRANSGAADSGTAWGALVT